MLYFTLTVDFYLAGYWYLQDEVVSRSTQLRGYVTAVRPHSLSLTSLLTRERAISRRNWQRVC